MSKRKNQEGDMHVSRDEVYLQLPQQRINIRCGIQKKLPGLLDPGFDDAELLLHFLSVPQLLSRLSPLGPGLCQEAEDEETHPGLGLSSCSVVGEGTSTSCSRLSAYWRSSVREESSLSRSWLSTSCWSNRDCRAALEAFSTALSGNRLWSSTRSRPRATLRSRVQRCHTVVMERLMVALLASLPTSSSWAACSSKPLSFSWKLFTRQMRD
ncbi:hypothetical protein EYF80_036479 [Liparis tanakae]|uniref:Uncharacterized protein n=1 Tax=Liparis tanakae TaxID=230148 RepID=A0A4Z2GJA2_9TELE|nr:hypothetical protein EYF80_036479 [Liparis tanakae]